VDGENWSIAVAVEEIDQSVAVGVSRELVEFDLGADGHHAAVEFGAPGVE